jgi:hypothetical protein
MMKVKQTKQEQRTAEIEERIERHLKSDWPEEFASSPFSKNNLSFLCLLPPVHEMWSYDFIITDQESSEETVRVYCVWNGNEIVSYARVEEAISDFVGSVRESQIHANWRFFSSPLIMSGTLALGMLLIIAVLSIQQADVPPQLWSVFTAVIAFYFGKEGWTSLRGPRDSSA